MIECEPACFIQVFDSVTSILFLAAASEFDQRLLEDNETNRMREAVNVFESLVNFPGFARVSFILFLNKMDLLQEKVSILSGGSIYDVLTEGQGGKLCSATVLFVWEGEFANFGHLHCIYFTSRKHLLYIFGCLFDKL